MYISYYNNRRKSMLFRQNKNAIIKLAKLRLLEKYSKYRDLTTMHIFILKKMRPK